MVWFIVMSNAEQIDAEPEPALITSSYIIPEEVEIPLPEPTPMIFQATAYDLSIQCCSKGYGNPSRGITASGYNVTGMSREQAMVVSSNDFPLGTELDISFDDESYNGIYTVKDTGNMRSGVLDVYVGDFGERVSEKAISFGRQSAEVEVLE
jgi:3D (Asp-Asp-Asp) domain-containing protein